MDILDKINSAKVERKFRKKKMIRRALKLAEECGEVADAVLDVTSKFPSKGKTWADVREELTDVILVAGDMILQEYPDEEYSETERYQKIRERINIELDRKIKKWESRSGN